MIQWNLRQKLCPDHKLVKYRRPYNAVLFSPTLTHELETLFHWDLICLPIITENHTQHFRIPRFTIFTAWHGKCTRNLPQGLPTLTLMYSVVLTMNCQQATVHIHREFELTCNKRNHWNEMQRRCFSEIFQSGFWDIHNFANGVATDNPPVLTVHSKQTESPPFL